MTTKEAARLWIATLVIAALPVVAALWADRPPAPVAATAPATEFSEERAWPVVEELAGRIGKRITGTPGAREAADYLERRLRDIPGLEVEVQAAVLDTTRSGRPVRAWVRNVLARLPGTEPTAVLLSAHYDSQPAGMGAADDAVGVAAIVETARALAAGPKLRHTVVFNLNEGEELGLYGSEAFLEHAWANDVCCFLNLEAAGNGGRPVLFQAGAGTWLAAAYARGAPRPHGSVFAQDVFESGIIPSDTDFRIYRDEGGLPGLDVALYQDGWAYHTHLDTVERVQRGSLQEMGENALGAVREIASLNTLQQKDEAPAVFYDVLGRFMFRYSRGAGYGWAGIALALVVFSLVLGLLAHRLVWQTIVAGFALNLLTFLAAVALPLAIAWLVAGILDRPFGWYPRPWAAVVAFGAPAAGVVLACHGVVAGTLEQKSLTGERARPLLLAGYAVGWSLILLALCFAGLASAYIAHWWVLPGALGLAIALVRPDRPLLALAVGYLPGALLTSQLAIALVTNFVPMAGRMQVGFPFDYAIAAMVALPVAACTLAMAPTLHAAGPRFWKVATAACFALTAAGVAVIAGGEPYTPERPRRISLSMLSMDAASGSAAVRTLTLGAEDHLPLGHRLELPEFDPASPVYHGDTELAFPLEPSISVEVRGGHRSAGSWDTCVLRVEPRGAVLLTARFPDDRSMSFVAPPAEGFEYEFVHSGAAEGVTVRALYTTLRADVRELIEGLPGDWAVDPYAIVETTVPVSR